MLAFLLFLAASTSLVPSADVMLPVSPVTQISDDANRTLPSVSRSGPGTPTGGGSQFCRRWPHLCA